MVALLQQILAVTAGAVLRRERQQKRSSLHRELLGCDDGAALVVLTAIFVSIASADSRAAPMLSASAQGNTAVAFERQLTPADSTPIITNQSPTANGIVSFPVWAVFTTATSGAKRRRDRSSAAEAKHYGADKF